MSAENQQPKEQKRGPGWPPTRDQSVFDPLNGPVEQLVQAVLWTPRSKPVRKEHTWRISDGPMAKRA